MAGKTTTYRDSATQNPTPAQFGVPGNGAPVKSDPSLAPLGSAPALHRAEAQTSSSQARSGERAYYNISPLKASLWRWEIASYFYLGGLSSGAYMLARVADRMGGEKYRDLTRVGSFVALLSLLPCPPLLIADLGDPARFHHMLRVWKPSSPMNLGAWTLTGYSGACAASVVRELLHDPKTPLTERSKLRKFATSTLVMVHDAAGIPLALLLLGYTGVLLSGSSNPLWTKNTFLGPLFSASAISTGAAATSLALEFCEKPVHAKSDLEASHRALERVDTAAHLIEAVSLAGFFATTGERAKPLTSGKQSHHLYITIGGIALSTLLSILPFKGKLAVWRRRFTSMLSLISGFSLRWGMVYGGIEAANDPHLARLVGNPDEGKPRTLSQSTPPSPLAPSPR